VCKLTFTSGTIDVGGTADVNLGINYVVGWQWHTFNQDDDWSYQESSTYIEAETVVMRDSNGDIVWGTAPEAGNPRPTAIPVYWLGARMPEEMEEITILEGDAYRSLADGRAYVYYEGAWMLMDEYLPTGGDVSVVDNGIGADNVQAALESLAARITALEAENTALQAQVTQNSTDIASLIAAQAEFVTEAALNAVLSNYVTVTTLVESLANYATEAFVEDALDDYTPLDETAALADRLLTVEEKTAPMTVVDDDVMFDGVNVHIRSGSGATDGPVNGLGNLIVGYSETAWRNPNPARTGSHNLVVGSGHDYTSYGGVTFGWSNTVTEQYSSVLAGFDNLASGEYSAVTGGAGGTASGMYSAVSAGTGNTANETGASVSGGSLNTASGVNASVSGGQDNVASGGDASVSGGLENTASGGDSSVSGGDRNTASAGWASVSGGQENVASGGWASVSGGDENTAAGNFSSVSGGDLRTASGYNDWVAGALWQDE
jgi:hypothetical protein